jgi:hypothetical protein
VLLFSSTICELDAFISSGQEFKNPVVIVIRLLTDSETFVLHFAAQIRKAVMQLGLSKWPLRSLIPQYSVAGNGRFQVAVNMRVNYHCDSIFKLVQKVVHINMLGDCAEK